MTGGLLQLVAYGAQDIYLTGNPQITFFKVVYRRHTNFALESIENVFSGVARFGNRVTCQLSRNGDLINRVYLVTTLPALKANYTASIDEQPKWVKSVGLRLVQNIWIEIGGQQIDKHYSEWMYIWNELSLPAGKRAGYDKMVGNTAGASSTLPGSATSGVVNGGYPVNSQNRYIYGSSIYDDEDDAVTAAGGGAYVTVNNNLLGYRWKIHTPGISDSPGPWSFYNTIAAAETAVANWVNGLTATVTQAIYDNILTSATLNDPDGSDNFNLSTSLNNQKKLIIAIEQSRIYPVYGSGVKPGDVPAKTLHIPLEFWFCRNVGLALPLIALQYHEVKINIDFESLANCYTGTLKSGEAPELGDASLWVDYIYLDTDERRRFAQLSHEYLIEQLQYTGDEQVSATSSRIKLNFNHPVKELVWVAKDVAHQWVDYSDDVGGNPMTSALIQLNGQDRFMERTSEYFDLVQPYQHHENIPVSSPGINVYSFALKPEEHQPSGSLNFSRIDTAYLSMKLVNNNSRSVKVFAVNYNVLRIMSGMGGLAYSN